LGLVYDQTLTVSLDNQHLESMHDILNHKRIEKLSNDTEKGLKIDKENTEHIEIIKGLHMGQQTLELESCGTQTKVKTLLLENIDLRQNTKRSNNDSNETLFNENSEIRFDSERKKFLGQMKELTSLNDFQKHEIETLKECTETSMLERDKLITNINDLIGCNDSIQIQLNESQNKVESFTKIFKSNQDKIKELSNVKLELEESKCKVNDLSDSNHELLNKLRNLEERIAQLNNERDSFQNYSGRIRDIASTNDKGFQELQEKLKHELQTSEKYLDTIVDLKNDMELGLADRECLEIKLKNATEGVQIYKDRIEELELQIDLTQLGELGPDYQKQIMDERLREALIKLRNVTSIQEAELKFEIEKLEAEAGLSESRNIEIQALKRDKELSDSNIQFLKLQLEAALDSEDIIYSLMEKNLVVGEELNSAKTRLTDFELLQNVNNELEKYYINQVSLKQEVIDNLVKRFKNLSDIKNDSEMVMEKFRNKCNQLDVDLKILHKKHDELIENTKSTSVLLLGKEKLERQLNVSENEVEYYKLQFSQSKVDFDYIGDEMKIYRSFIPFEIHPAVLENVTLFMISSKMILKFQNVALALSNISYSSANMGCLVSFKKINQYYLYFQSVTGNLTDYKPNGILDKIIDYSNKIIGIFDKLFQDSCDCDKLLKGYIRFIYSRILLDFQAVCNFVLPTSSGDNLKNCWNDLISLELTSMIHDLQNFDELSSLKNDIVQMIDSNNRVSLVVNKLRELLATKEAAGFVTGELSSKSIIQFRNSVETSFFKIGNVLYCYN
jgi:hypothetical protein